MTRATIMPFTAACLWVAALADSAPAADWADAMFSEREHDFGGVARGAKAEYQFTAVNRYKEPMELLDVRSSCGCTIPRIKNGDRRLETGERGAVVARVNSTQFTGRRGATLTVRIKRPRYPHVPPVEVRLQVKVHIRDDVSVQPSVVQFGQIDQGTAYRQTVRVRCRGGRWGPRVEGVACDHPHLTAELIPQRANPSGRTYELRVVIDDRAPPGYITHYLTLAAAGRRAEPIHVRVEGRVMPPLQISPTPLLLGTLEPGQRATKPLVIRAGRPFRITGVQCPGGGLSWQLPEPQEVKRIHVVPFTFTAAEGEAGRMERAVTLSTDLGSEPATFSVQAIVRQPDTLAAASDGVGSHGVGKPADGGSADR